MAPIGAAGPQCLAGSPQQACHTEPHHQPKTAPTQHRAPLNTCLSGAQQAPRSAWSAPREVSHCLARASGNCATNCPALEASEVDIRGKPTIPPKGALMQTYCLRATHPYSRRAASRSRTARQASSIPPLTKPSSAISSSSARASFPLTTPQSSVVIRPSISAASWLSSARTSSLTSSTPT